MWKKAFAGQVKLHSSGGREMLTDIEVAISIDIPLRQLLTVKRVLSGGAANDCQQSQGLETSEYAHL